MAGSVSLAPAFVSSVLTQPSRLFLMPNRLSSPHLQVRVSFPGVKAWCGTHWLCSPPASPPRAALASPFYSPGWELGIKHSSFHFSCLLSPLWPYLLSPCPQEVCLGEVKIETEVGVEEKRHRDDNQDKTGKGHRGPQRDCL